MRAFIVFLLFVIFALTARWYYVCKIKNLCEKEPIVEVVEDVRPKNLTLKDGEEVILDDYDNFRFDSAAIIPVLNDNNLEFLDKVAAYLKNNPDKNLTLTAYYRASEKDMAAGMFENLGLARANTIRSYLIERGIDESRFSLDFKAIEGENLDNPISFDLYTPDRTVPDDFEKVQFSFQNMTFSDANFEYNSAEFRPGEQFLLYADSLKTYFELNPDKALTIIGHTDSIGSQGYNLGLGEQRAKSAKEYLEEMGIIVDIKTDSEGKLKPMAPNQTEEGRQKNRRVNFKIE